MRELATPNGSKLPEPRGIRYSIRALMLVAALVCLAAATYASFESVPFTMFDRGEDTVISTAEFEIVLLGQQFNGQPMNGQFLFGGLWRRGGGRIDYYWGTNQKAPHRTILHEYSWGRLRVQIDKATFSIDRRGRKVRLNNASYSIRNRAVITVDELDNVSVEDVKPSRTASQATAHPPTALRLGSSMCSWQSRFLKPAGSAHS